MNMYFCVASDKVKNTYQIWKNCYCYTLRMILKPTEIQPTMEFWHFWYILNPFQDISLFGITRRASLQPNCFHNSILRLVERLQHENEATMQTEHI